MSQSISRRTVLKGTAGAIGASVLGVTLASGAGRANTAQAATTMNPHALADVNKLGFGRYQGFCPCIGLPSPWRGPVHLTRKGAQKDVNRHMS